MRSALAWLNANLLPLVLIALFIASVWLVSGHANAFSHPEIHEAHKLLRERVTRLEALHGIPVQPDHVHEHTENDK